MPTLVAFHAHPDDEAIFTGGTILHARAAGWRVVLVVATCGEEGTPDTDGAGALGARRRAETRTAAGVLGIEAVHFLDYRDSGTWWTRNGGDPRALAGADEHTAASRLRLVLLAERATALTTYDTNGIYGHPDHVAVHRIGARAALGTDCELYEATVGRAQLLRLRTELLDRGLLPDSWPEALTARIGVGDDGAGGTLLRTDVSDVLDTKLAAMAAHGSQLAAADTFMGLPAGAFHRLLWTEWFIEARAGAGRFRQLLESSTPADQPAASARARSVT